VNVAIADARTTSPDFLDLPAELTALLVWHAGAGNMHPIDILIGIGGNPAPTLLLPYLDQRVAVKVRVSCPRSGTQFSPQPDMVFPVW
jgi:hypothetical protein